MHQCLVLKLVLAESDALSDALRLHAQILVLAESEALIENLDR